MTAGGIAARAVKARLRVVSRTPEEEAAIERLSPSEDGRGVASFAAWKFELIKDATADPMLSPASVVLILTYLHFVNRETFEAYLSEIEAQVRTGGLKGLQPRAIRAAKKELVGLGYMTPTGKTGDGVVRYRFANPRREVVAENIILSREFLQDAEAMKRTLERRRRLRRGYELAPPADVAGGTFQPPTGGTFQPPNSLEQPLESILHEGSKPQRADAWGIKCEADTWAKQKAAEIIALENLGRAEKTERGSPE